MYMFYSSLPRCDPGRIQLFSWTRADEVGDMDLNPTDPRSTSPYYRVSRLEDWHLFTNARMRFGRPSHASKSLARVMMAIGA